MLMLVVAPAAVRGRELITAVPVRLRVRDSRTGVVVYFDTFKYKFTTSRYHASAKFRGKWSEASRGVKDVSVQNDTQVHLLYFENESYSRKNIDILALLTRF